MSLIVYFKDNNRRNTLLDGFLYGKPWQQKTDIVSKIVGRVFSSKRFCSFFSEHFFFQDQMLSVHFHPFCITESFLEFHSFITWCTSHVHVFFLCSLHHLPLHFTLTRDTFLIRQFAPQKTVTCAKNFGIGAEGGGL